jgi:cytochrome c peroxidase
MRYQLPIYVGVFGMFGLFCCDSTVENPIKGPTSVSLETPDYFPANQLMPADNPLTEEGVKLGRMLFYEKNLSSDRSISCGSCHQQQKAFTDGKKRSPGVNSILGSKNGMSLSNVHWSTKFFWDGRVSSLEEQSIQPIQETFEMNLPIEEAILRLQQDEKYPGLFESAFGNSQITLEMIGKAIAQFERTLISSNSKFDRWIKNEVELSEEEKLGMELFFTHPDPAIQLRGGNCSDCHLGFLTSGESQGFLGFHNNGLDTDENLDAGLFSVTQNPFDIGKFKAPGLRNIALTAPYMHDGRFGTLEEVLDHYNEHIQNSETLDVLILEASNEIIDQSAPIKLHLSDNEKKAIITFLPTY